MWRFCMNLQWLQRRTDSMPQVLGKDSGTGLFLGVKIRDAFRMNAASATSWRVIC